jgi:hypothetical protein
MRGALIWSTGITAALVRSIFNEMMTLRVDREPGNDAKSGSLALCRRNNRLWREFNTQALFRRFGALECSGAPNARASQRWTTI